MFKNTYITIIVLIIIYQIFLDCTKDFEIDSENEKDDINKKPKNISVTNKSLSESSKKTESITNVSSEESEKSEKELPKKQINEEHFTDFGYGDAHQIKNINGNKIYIWLFKENIPWSKIIYNQNSEYMYEYTFKVEIPSLKVYKEWKTLIPNIYVEPNTSEITIPCNDEEGALTVCNLIINNFQNKISIDQIMKEDIINQTINKLKKYKTLKIKLKNQIIQLLNGYNKSNSRKDYSQDLSLDNRQFNNINKNHNVPTTERFVPNITRGANITQQIGSSNFNINHQVKENFSTYQPLTSMEDATDFSYV
jgi:hypothetical protein